MNESTTRTRSGKVTEASVAEAARKLVEAGQNPTLEAVLQHLGGGSQNLASRLLREWKASQPKAKAPEIQLDPKIASMLAEQLVNVSRAAASAAEERANVAEKDIKKVEDAGEALEAKIEDLEAALASLQDQHQQQGGLVQALRGEIVEVRAEAEKQVALAKIDAEKQIAEAKAETERERQSAKLAHTELAKAELRLEALPDLQADAKRLGDELKEAQAGRNAAEQQAAVLVAQDAAARARIEDLSGRLEIAEKRALEAYQESKNQAAAAGEASKAGLSASTQLEAAQRELEGLREALVEAKAELKEVRAELKAARKSE